MMGLIRKFAASPFSGYLAIGLLIAAAGAGYWFWTELKSFGSLEAVAESRAREISSLENQVSYLNGQNDLKQQIGTMLSKTEQSIDQKYDSMNLEIQEALKNVSKEYLNCRDMLVPGRLRYPDRNKAHQDQAGSADDG